MNDFFRVLVFRQFSARASLISAYVSDQFLALRSAVSLSVLKFSGLILRSVRVLSLPLLTLGFAVAGLLSPDHAFAKDGTTIEKIISEQKAATFVKGAAIYNQVCASCHATNNIMVASPKFGSRADWEARLKENKSLKGLVKSAIAGKGPMPKKGLCPNCTSAELEAAIVYMMRGEE